MFWRFAGVEAVRCVITQRREGQTSGPICEKQLLLAHQFGQKNDFQIISEFSFPEQVRILNPCSQREDREDRAVTTHSSTATSEWLKNKRLKGSPDVNLKCRGETVRKLHIRERSKNFDEPKHSKAGVFNLS